jgi:hypothetical protein
MLGLGLGLRLGLIDRFLPAAAAKRAKITVKLYTKKQRSTRKVHVCLI